MNPYLFDVASGKKSIKKKSESIDFVRLLSFINLVSKPDSSFW